MTSRQIWFRISLLFIAAAVIIGGSIAVLFWAPWLTLAEKWGILVLSLAAAGWQIYKAERSYSERS